MGLLLSSLLPTGNPPLSVGGQVKHPGVPDGFWANEPTMKAAAMKKRSDRERNILNELNGWVEKKQKTFGQKGESR